MAPRLFLAFRNDLQYHDFFYKKEIDEKYLKVLEIFIWLKIFEKISGDMMFILK